MPPVPPSTAVPAAVWRAIAIIEDRYCEALTVSEIAHAVERHRAYLARIFRQSTGQTIHTYLARVRIGHAATLIAAGQKVEAAMLEVGYRSKKNFYRQFRLATGLTPSAYRVVIRSVIPTSG